MNTETIILQLAPDARILDVTPLTGGVSAEVHAVSFRRHDGSVDEVVVRRHRDFEGKAERGERAAREHALLGVLHARGLAVPRSRMHVPPDTVVLDRMPGSTTLPIDPAQQFADALAEIHAISAQAELPELPLLDNPLPGLREWAPELFEDARFARGYSAFAGTPCLLHGDYWPGNVLWLDGRLAAILDWEDAGFGDPLSDVACARVELSCAVGIETAEQFTNAYRARSTSDFTRLPWWDLFVSSAALASMGAWGLAPDALAARQAETGAFRTRALRALEC